ncbi:DMT family transporter [Streptomyces sp. PT12]|uniref:DMT family transporter n=1 Tax=Streptomyces sp. PT12 TaxID=1510197 RepID=UPI00215BEED6|nr:DMT family transporter [Streptomyces sp. PT12]
MAALAVVAFSLTFPATTWALEGFGPWTVTFARTVVAALIAACALAAARVPPPERRHLPGLALVAAGCVLGFPLLTALALPTSGTAHAAVVTGLLPLTTAIYATARTGARPSPVFWAAAAAGAAAVVAFAAVDSGGSPARGDLYLAAALLLCAAGYAEGGRLAGRLPGWQVISWALVASLPLALPGFTVALLAEPPRPTASSLAAVLWLAAGASFLSMLVWYGGLARAGIARASQLQLAQPLLTLVWSTALLAEPLPAAAPLTAIAVLACIAITQRAPRHPAVSYTTPDPHATRRPAQSG